MRSRRRNKSWLMMMAATTLHNTDSYMLTTPPSLSQPSYMTTALPSTCHYLTICHMTSPRTHVHTIHQCYTVVIRLIFQTCQLSHTVCVTHAFQWYIMFTHKQTHFNFCTDINWQVGKAGVSHHFTNGVAHRLHQGMRICYLVLPGHGMAAHPNIVQ